MRVLAFDVGERRTGVAFVDGKQGVPLPLPSLEHTSRRRLLMDMISLIDARAVHCVVLGLPLLLSGKEGKQAAYVRSVEAALRQRGDTVHCVDERYSTPRFSCHGDAEAACAILSVFLAQRAKKGI